MNDEICLWPRISTEASGSVQARPRIGHLWGALKSIFCRRQLRGPSSLDDALQDLDARTLRDIGASERAQARAIARRDSIRLDVDHISSWR